MDSVKPNNTRRQPWTPTQAQRNRVSSQRRTGYMGTTTENNSKNRQVIQLTCTKISQARKQPTKPVSKPKPVQNKTTPKFKPKTHPRQHQAKIYNRKLNRNNNGTKTKTIQSQNQTNTRPQPNPKPRPEENHQQTHNICCLQTTRVLQ